ncbi:hypothetical protein B0H10DRAFT_1950765 [Mycena sp. CBHHK59/15]|nr:hypothetical protein B0H10DRAFT_1950765 [Mycena sp. CBHHK59/15]
MAAFDGRLTGRKCDVGRGAAAPPRFPLIIQDDKDSSERGRTLVSSPETWQTQVAKWIGDPWAADCADSLADTSPNNEVSDDDEIAPWIPNRLPTWKPIMLQVLFGGAEKICSRRPLARVRDEEERLMQALADAEEDAYPDDGAIEIDSDEEYGA